MAERLAVADRGVAQRVRREHLPQLLAPGAARAKGGVPGKGAVQVLLDLVHLGALSGGDAAE